MAGPDYTSILTALTGGTDKAIEETNPWSGLENFSNTFGTALTQAAPQYDLQDSLIAGLLTGAVGGLSRNFSNDYKNTQKDYAAQAVKDLIEGKSLVRENYSSMAPGVFNVLDSSQNAITLANQQDAAEQQRQLEAQIKLKQTPSFGEVPSTSQEAQNLEYKIRSEQPLTEEDYKVFAALPNDVKRILGQVQTQQAIDKRSELVSDRQEKGFQFRESFDPSLNREMFNKQSVADAFLTSKANIDLALSKFNPNEDLISAASRGVVAGTLKDSDAADLQRQISMAAFAMLKPTFPGSISDQEREQLMKVSGGDFGVPIGTIQKIFDRQENAILKNVNKDLMRLNAAGYRNKFSPLGEAIQGGQSPQQSGGIPANAQDTGRTFQGKKVYSVDGKMWVPD